jgi:hypothetical protein
MREREREREREKAERNKAKILWAENRLRTTQLQCAILQERAQLTPAGVSSLNFRSLSPQGEVLAQRKEVWAYRAKLCATEIL